MNTKDLYDKKIQCPVCNSDIFIRSVKSSAQKILSRDSDFMIRYDDPNPMLYNAWVCNQCGYSALPDYFDSITDKQIQLVKEKICSRWQPREYPDVYDIETAIERYKLVLLNAMAMNAKESRKAYICLRIAWLFRMQEDAESENKFLMQALQGFIKAYETENFPMCGMDLPTLSYLIGELYRRLDDAQNALLWFGRVLGNRESSEKIKEMAREQKYLIRQNVT